MDSFSHRLRAKSAFLLVIALVPFQAYSQTAGGNGYLSNANNNSHSNHRTYNLDKRMNEFGVWGGGSFDSPTLIGTATGRKFLILGFRYGRIFAAGKQVTYEYTFDAVPLALVFQPEFVRSINGSSESKLYGFGISPIGFKANFNRENRVKPFLNLSGGFLYFRNPVPLNVPQATRFNFTFDFGGGIHLFTNSRQAITLGYKFHHISNADRSDVNPGLDANVFYAGFSIFK